MVQFSTNMRTYFKMLCLLMWLSVFWSVECVPPPHPVVLQLRQQESELPDFYKSPALHNSRLRRVLPLTSLLHHGETPVYERPIVPRSSIISMLTHAGFVRRNPNLNGAPHSRQQHHRAFNHDFVDPPLFPNPDLLQHL